MMIYKKIITLFFLLTTALFANDVSAYLIYKDMKTVKDAKDALAKNGFEVIGEYNPIKDKNNVIVFTHPELKKMASKENRAFSAVLKLLVLDGKGSKATNPEYFLKAMLQSDYDAKVGANMTALLGKAFGKSKGTKHLLEDDALEHYHFMFGMPYYEDLVKVASGDKAKLIKSLKANAGDDLVFELELDNGTYLAGVKFAGNRGESFYTAKIDPKAKNVASLPYMVFIENGEAKIMHAKFYLALSYPLLEMVNFMKIGSTPGEIEDFFRNLFK